MRCRELTALQNEVSDRILVAGQSEYGWRIGSAPSLWLKWAIRQVVAVCYIYTPAHLGHEQLTALV